MSKDKNENDAPLDAEISGAVAALSSMKEKLNQRMAPTIPDTISETAASLSDMSKSLAQETSSLIPDSLTAAAATMKKSLDQVSSNEAMKGITAVANEIKDYYNRSYDKDRLAQMFSSVRLVGDSPEVLRLQSLLRNYSGLISLNQAVLQAYIEAFGRQWEQADKAKEPNDSVVPAQNFAILKFIADPNEQTLPRGSKSVLKGLPKPAAESLVLSEGIFFDVKEKKFFKRNSPKQKVSSRQIAVATSAQQLFKDITQEELIAFEGKLFENPSFANQDPVGQKILNRIAAWTYRVDLEQNAYYHARRLEVSRKEYADEEMHIAPPNVTSHGRFNAIGRPCYYVTDTKRGAVREITKHCRSESARIQVIGLHPKRNAKILDLSCEIDGSCPFLEYLRRPAKETPSGNVPVYMLPNYVADCCKARGIAGIKYKSSKSAEYNCIVLWEDEYFEFIEGSSEVIEWKKKIKSSKNARDKR